MAWQRLTLVVDGADAPATAARLEELGAISIDIADADAGTPGEQAIFAEPGAESAGWRRCSVSALFAQGEAPDLEGASVERLEDEDWVAATQRQFEPIRAGERLWIVPTWHTPPQPGAINVVLDPGAAFGTGSHPTTRLCLAWLERNVLAGCTVLDYGCGSGILAIAAMKLGARAAVAVDLDPLALEAARYNASRNAVAIDVRDAQAQVDVAAHVTVANILPNPLRVLAPAIAAHTRPGGSIALCGILESQAGEVIASYAPWAALEVAGCDAGWVLLAGRRC